MEGRQWDEREAALRLRAALDRAGYAWLVAQVDEAAAAPEQREGSHTPESGELEQLLDALLFTLGQGRWLAPVALESASAAVDGPVQGPIEFLDETGEPAHYGGGNVDAESIDRLMNLVQQLRDMRR